MHPNTNNQIIKGSIWVFISQVGSMSLVLISSIILARIIPPADYGKLGIMMFFMAIANVLVDGGLSGALIRKTNITKEDYSTVFSINLLISVFLFVIFLSIAKTIAFFYNDISLHRLFQALSLVLIFNAFQIVPTVRLMIGMNYKRLALYDLTSTLLGMSIGVTMGYLGYGIWALVSMQLFGSLIKTILLWIFEEKSTSFFISKQSLRELWSFGVNMITSSFIVTAFDNIYQIIIGRVFSVISVGYFYQAKRLMDSIVSVINAVTQGPVFSGLSKVQLNKQDFAKSYNRISLVSMSLIGLCAILIFFYSEFIIILLFTAKWLDSAIYLKYFAIIIYFFTIEALTRVIFKVYNKASMILSLNIITRVIQLISIFIAVILKNMEALLIGLVFSNIIGRILGYVTLSKFIKFNISVDVKQNAKILVIAILTLSIALLLENCFSIKGNEKLLLLMFILPFYSMLIILSDKYYLCISKKVINSIKSKLKNI